MARGQMTGSFSQGNQGGAAPVAGVCARCEKKLRANARFCTRCGTAVMQTPPLVFRVPEPIPRPVRRGASESFVRAPRPRKARRFVWFFRLLVVTFIFFAAILINARQGFSPLPMPPTFLVTTPAEQRLPVAPDPARPLPARTGLATNAQLRGCWIDTNAVDSDGVVGFRVHAEVSAPGLTGLRLVAHFRTTSQNPIRSGNPVFRDVRGEAAAAGVVLPSTVPIMATAFIPLTALDLSNGDNHLKVLPALFDPQNRPIATGLSIPFEFHRGTIYITSARGDSLSNGGRRIKLTVDTGGRPSPIFGQVIARFKDGTGTPIPGRPMYTNADGELIVQSNFYIPPGAGHYSSGEITLTTPPGLVPPIVTAEIRLYDPSAHAWITGPLDIQVP